MDQLKNTTVRFGITDALDFEVAGQQGDWQFIDVNFPAPFGPPKPGFPKGVPQQISVVATPLEMHVQPVAVVKNVTSTGFRLWARNAMNKTGTARFAWLAVLGVPDTHTEKYIDARLGVLQTKVLAPGPKVTQWPGVWFSDPLVGINRVVLLTAHNNSGPSHWGTQWHSAAAVASVYPISGAISAILPDDGFSVGAVTVDTEGRCGYYYAALVEARHSDKGGADELFIDHGSEKGVENSFRYNQVTWPAPPDRRLKPGGIPGDWLHLDVYFDRPFLTPPVVLLTARDNDGDVKKHFNPLVPIAQNVSTHGFTAAVRNTDTIDAMAEFYWVAIGCNAGCG